MLYSNFPKNDKLYFVKWIDRLTVPLDQTRSAGMQVFLQDLGINSPEYLQSRSKTEFARLIARPTSNQKESGDFGTFEPIQVKAHAASLPVIPLGGLFKNQRLVGIAPHEQHEVIIKAGRSNCYWIKLNEQAKKPYRWGSDLPYFILMDRYYEYVQRKYKDSEVFVVETERADFIIPAIVMFQAFYGQTSQMIQAFTGGPWGTTASQVIHFGRTESGFETHVDTSSGDWHIILQQKVRDIYARHLAMLWFDPYARKCAESIYTHALKAKRANKYGSVHVHAELPYRPEFAVTLRVNAILLESWKEQTRPGHERFLVTSIDGAKPPSYLPTIWSERVNSGAQGAVVEKAENTPAPYSNTAPTTQPDDIGMPAIDDILSADLDGSLQNLGLPYNLGTFEWIDAPEIKKIPKEFSRSYPSQPKPPAEPSGLMSTGDPSHSAGGDRLEASVLVREAVNRFTHLLHAMKELHGKKTIEGYHVVAPNQSDLLIIRGGVQCWNFLSDEERRTGKPDKRGWAVFRQSKKDYAINIPSNDLRSALIVNVQLKGAQVFWIEVECRHKEAITSLVVRNDHCPPTDYFVDVLQRIAAIKGISMKQTTAALFSKIGGKTESYRHQYKSPTNPQLDPSSLARVLAKLVPSSAETPEAI